MVSEFVDEKVSRGSGGLGTVLAAHVSLAASMVYEFGTDPQREQYLSPMAAGTDVGAFALSEAGAGSDVSSMQTTARRTGEEYVVTGDKLWVSNGAVADTVVLFAKTDPDAGSDGVSSFVVRPDEDDGVHIVGTEDTLGDRG